MLNIFKLWSDIVKLLLPKTLPSCKVKACFFNSKKTIISMRKHSLHHQSYCFFTIVKNIYVPNGVGKKRPVFLENKACQTVCSS